MICARQIATAAVCFVAIFPFRQFALRAQTSPAPGSAQAPILAPNPPPTAEQMKALLARIIENQHRDDRESEQFERVEHVSRKGENGDAPADFSERRIPSGAGDVKLKTAENGVPVPAAEYRHELEIGVAILSGAERLDDRYKEAQAKYEKRRHDRADLVEAAGKAFLITWAGRETRANTTGKSVQRNLSKYLLDPDPQYKPASRFAASFQHIHAAVWVDDAAAQIVRVEADIATDITFGGGVAGKVYHGGRVVMEQDEVEPGVWLPTLYTYDVDGRKFLFPFSMHERTEINQYHRIGLPREALKQLRGELNTLAAGAARENTPAAK